MSTARKPRTAAKLGQLKIGRPTVGAPQPAEQKKSGDLTGVLAKLRDRPGDLAAGAVVTELRPAAQSLPIAEEPVAPAPPVPPIAAETPAPVAEPMALAADPVAAPAPVAPPPVVPPSAGEAPAPAAVETVAEPMAVAADPVEMLEPVAPEIERPTEELAAPSAPESVLAVTETVAESPVEDLSEPTSAEPAFVEIPALEAPIPEAPVAETLAPEPPAFVAPVDTAPVDVPLADIAPAFDPEPEAPSDLSAALPQDDPFSMPAPEVPEAPGAPGAPGAAADEEPAVAVDPSLSPSFDSDSLVYPPQLPDPPPPAPVAVRARDEAAPAAAGEGAERRAGVQPDIYAYWLALKNGRRFPTVASLDQGRIARTWPNSLLLACDSGPRPKGADVRFMKAVKLGNPRRAEDPLREVNFTSMVTEWILTNGRNAVRETSPLESIDVFPARSGLVSYRVVVLPLSEDGSDIDHILCHVSLKA